MSFSAEFGGADRGQVDVMLTGTWLESEKLLAGLFFLLLLLLLLPPPELTVLPPDTFLFLRLFGACLAGSAKSSKRETPHYYLHNYSYKASPPIEPHLSTVST